MTTFEVEDDTLTLGVATYNGGETLRRALLSIERQTYLKIKVIISDDGSTDATWAICEEFCARNPRWKLVRNSHAPGMVGNYRSLLANAEGRYFAFLDQDDSRSPRFAEEGMRALLENPCAVGWACAIKVVWPTRPGSSDLTVMQVNTAPTCLESYQALDRLACLLRQYVDIWLYGIYQTDALRAAFESVKPSPVFPAVVMTHLILKGPILTSTDVLTEYRAKGAAERLTSDSQPRRANLRGNARSAIPFFVLQGLDQVGVCMQESSLPLRSRIHAGGIVARDVAAWLAAKAAYSFARRIDTPRVWAYADAVAESGHPRDHIRLVEEPYSSGYLARDWRGR